MPPSPPHPARPAGPGALRPAAPMVAAMGAAAAALLASGVAAATLTATAQAAPPTSAAASVAALSVNWYESAPYYSVLDSSAPDLGTVMSATGQKAFEMAFILADGGCAPAWNGTDPVSGDTQVAAVINEVRADGGDVIVSAGGYNGTKLGQVCGTAAATAAAYQQVDQHVRAARRSTSTWRNRRSRTRRRSPMNWARRRSCSSNNPGLFISVTIPSIATGANYFGQQLLDEAKTLGFTPDDYTIMPFDGGFNGGSSQVTALQDFNAQLVSTFGWSSSQAYAHEGFSGMNGRTDSAEYFYQSDFQTVLSFAESVGLGRYTFWSVNRDRECNPPGNNGSLSSECSSVTQNPWDFTAYTVAFAKSAPVTRRRPRPRPRRRRSPTPTPTPTTQLGRLLAAAWSSNTAYVSGNVVSYGGPSGPPTSGTTTRCPAAPRAPGTTAAPADTWRRGVASRPGATLVSPAWPSSPGTLPPGA